MKRMNGKRVVITQTSAFMGKNLVELFGAVTTIRSIASLSFYADDKRRESRMNGIRHEGVQANGVRLHVDRMGLELRTLSRCMAADNRLWGQRKIQALEAWVQSFQREEG